MHGKTLMKRNIQEEEYSQSISQRTWSLGERTAQIILKKILNAKLTTATVM
jgi:hypothetical protein